MDERLRVMCKWDALHKVIVNRVSIINQLHGCQYDNGITNPCKLRWRRGRYVVRYCGEVLVSYRLYELGTTRTAYEVLCALADALWLGRRAGVLVLTPS